MEVGGPNEERSLIFTVESRSDSCLIEKSAFEIQNIEDSSFEVLVWIALPAKSHVNNVVSWRGAARGAPIQPRPLRRLLSKRAVDACADRKNATPEGPRP